jgi:hypothetical protein
MVEKKETLPRIFKKEVVESKKLFQKINIEKNKQKELEGEGLSLFKSCKEILRRFGEPKEIHIEKYAGGGLIGMHLEPRRRWETPEVEIKRGRNFFKASIRGRDYEVLESNPDILSKFGVNEKEVIFAVGLDELFISYTFSNEYAKRERRLYLNERGESAFGNKGDKTPSLEELKNYQELCKTIGEKLAEMPKGVGDGEGAGSR